MKRRPPYIPSPTPAALPAIPTNRNDTLRQHLPPPPPPVLPVDFRTVSRIHYKELHRFLAEYLAKAPPNLRSNARQKLSRLTRHQFHELTTDVYDEVVRRKNVSGAFAIPFLPIKEGFHPKRNQARQKLALLPLARFEDLSSDVHFEIARRYLDFEEDVHTMFTGFPSPLPVSRARL